MSNDKGGWYFRKMSIDGGSEIPIETWEFWHSEEGKKCIKQGPMLKPPSSLTE